MEKLIQALIQELKVSLAGKETLNTVTAVEEKMKTLPQDEKEADKQKEECLHTLATISSESTLSQNNSSLIKPLTQLYEIFSSVTEIVNDDKADKDSVVYQANAELYGLLSTLMYCADDIDRAIKYVKEMVMLLEIEKTKEEVENSEAQDLEDDNVATAEKAMKTEGGQKYPASAYLYAPDSKKPSTWKLRIWETPDKKVTVQQLGRAVAAIGKGFRGKKVQGIPAEEMSKIKKKLKSLYKQQGVKEEDIPEIVKSSKGELEDMKEGVIMPDTKVEPVATETTVVPAAVLEVKTESPEVVDLKAQIASLSAKVETYEAKEKALTRMAEIKNKGLEVIFATEEAQKVEIEKLMKMTDEQYTEHVTLLELAKSAFSPKVEPMVKPKEEVKPQETKTEEPKSAEATQTVVPTPTVSTSEGSMEYKNAIEHIRAIWDIS